MNKKVQFDENEVESLLKEKITRRRQTKIQNYLKQMKKSEPW
jgi:hypothetical protein